MSYVYHFKPQKMIGARLFPLNVLLKTHPKIGDEHAKKYINRESTLLQTIPPLNCLWNDAIHLFPINPQIIIDVWRDLKFDLPQKRIEVIRIPSKILDESISSVGTKLIFLILISLS
jgi:hypothetical protein